MWQRIKNIYHLLVAFLANGWYGFPARKLTVIGVTGTDGKTTTTNMIYEILKAAGFKVSMMSTIKAVIGGKEYDTGFHVTTPDPHILPYYVKQAVAHGDKYFVLEISSHALDQNRAGFVTIAIGVLTNLSHEHLDYHKTFDRYAKAKFRLLHMAQDSIVIPDSIPPRVLPHLQVDETFKKVVRFGLRNGDETQRKWKFKLKVAGDFNIQNALAAASVASLLGIPREISKKALESFNGIPGRFEEFPTKRPYKVIIDFAHKPNALLQAIKTAREEVKKGGRVIVLFGCASERDVLKRPMMGEISARLADVTVLTDEDPRFEDSLAIIDDIAKGCRKGGAVEVKTEQSNKFDTKGHIFFKIPNRALAINFVIQKLARKGDIILLCGKGHERSINYRGIEEPWSEHEAVRSALKSK